VSQTTLIVAHTADHLVPHQTHKRARGLDALNYAVRQFCAFAVNNFPFVTEEIA